MFLKVDGREYEYKHEMTDGANTSLELKNLCQNKITFSKGHGNTNGIPGASCLRSLEDHSRTRNCQGLVKTKIMT